MSAFERTLKQHLVSYRIVYSRAPAAALYNSDRLAVDFQFCTEIGRHHVAVTGSNSTSLSSQADHDQRPVKHPPTRGQSLLVAVARRWNRSPRTCNYRCMWISNGHYLRGTRTARVITSSTTSAIIFTIIITSSSSSSSSSMPNPKCTALLYIADSVSSCPAMHRHDILCLQALSFTVCV